MNPNVFHYGVNAVCLIKNGKKYGMICSWAAQADYDKVLLVLGTQSVTGKNICKGDIIGVSALNEDQRDVVDALGYSHSDAADKLADIKYTIVQDSAILIDDASVCMVVRVLDVLHLEGCEDDNVVYGLIESVTTNDRRMLSLSQCDL